MSLSPQDPDTSSEDDSPIFATDVVGFRSRVLNVIATWVLGGIFGALAVFVELQFTVRDQIFNAGGDVWGAIADAVASVTSVGFTVLELPFDIARSLAFAAGPFAFLVGPLAFALTAAVIAAVLYALWILWQVIPGT